MAYNLTPLLQADDIVEVITAVDELSCADWTCHLGTKILMLAMFVVIAGSLIRRMHHPADSITAAGLVCAIASLFFVYLGWLTDIWPFAFAAIAAIGGVGSYLSRN